MPETPSDPLSRAHAVSYICRADGDYGATYITPNVCEQLGYRPEQFTADSRFWLANVHPDDRDDVAAGLSNLLENDCHSHQYRFLAADGSYRWVHDERQLIRDEKGRPARIVGYWLDISRIASAKHDLEVKTQRLDAVYQSMVDGIIIIDPSGSIQSVNPAAEQLFGFREHELRGRNVKALMPQRYAREHDRYISDYLETGQGKIIGIGPREVQALHKDGTVIPIDLAVSEARVDGNRVFIGVVRDITERQQARENLLRMANYDQLTGLPNRTLFRERLKHAMMQADRTDRLVAVLYLDIDRFKLVNDSLGHEAGDLMLREIAARLRQIVRESDTVARLGGDEFAIILEQVRDIDETALVAQKVIDALVEPICIYGRDIHSGTSIGITIHPFDDTDIEQLLKNADTAMYRAKEAGGNRYRFYAAAMGESVRRHLEIESALRVALQNDQYVLHYQPKVDLHTGRITGVEALLRWHSPTLGLSLPSEFIPILEDTGLIHETGLWVLEQACRQVQEWIDQGLPPISVAVNVSARQFDKPTLVRDIAAIIGRVGINPALVELELTESVVMEQPTKACKTLDALHALGLKLAIDDFGTGYSSLANLKQLPFDTLKLDRAFVRELPHDSTSIGVTRAVIALADALKITTVAEGVETREQLRFLIRNGCTSIQGFYFSRPVRADELRRQLADNKRLTVAERRADHD